jgi:glycerol-3-phosphate dehydrogenase
MVREDPTLAARVVPDLPYIMAEVVYACRYEMAATLGDVLERRTRIGFEDWARGTNAAARVARCMAGELGWDEGETARQVAAYIAQVERDSSEPHLHARPGVPNP